MTDCLNKWMDAYKKQTYPNGWQKGMTKGMKNGWQKEYDHLDPKWTPKRNFSQQRQMHKVPTDDVVNTNNTNSGGDIRFANKPRTVPRGTERNVASGPEVQKSYYDQHILKDSKTRQKTLIWCGLTTKKHMILPGKAR